MANEFKHVDAGVQLTRTEDNAVGRHVFNDQATGDMLYSSSATQNRRLGIGSSNQILTVSSGIPAWSSSASLTTLGLSGKLTMSRASGAITDEEHLLSVAYGGTLSSGDSMIGINSAVTPIGTGGAWVAGIFASVTQGATKAVNGYISAAEFELNNSAALASAMSCLTLNWNNSSSSPGAPGGSTQAYIQLRDYSSGTPCSNLFEFTDLTVGTTTTTEIMTSVSDGYEANCLYALKFTVKNVPYWFLVSKVDPS